MTLKGEESEEDIELQGLLRRADKLKERGVTDKTKSVAQVVAAVKRSDEQVKSKHLSEKNKDAPPGLVFSNAEMFYHGMEGARDKQRESKKRKREQRARERALKKMKKQMDSAMKDGSDSSSSEEEEKGGAILDDEPNIGESMSEALKYMRQRDFIYDDENQHGTGERMDQWRPIDVEKDRKFMEHLDWSPSQVVKWLKTIKLDRYKRAFKKYKING